jgi:hypothetical protein
MHTVEGRRERVARRCHCWWKWTNQLRVIPDGKLASVGSE